MQPYQLRMPQAASAVRHEIGIEKPAKKLKHIHPGGRERTLLHSKEKSLLLENIFAPDASLCQTKANKIRASRKSLGADKKSSVRLLSIPGPWWRNAVAAG